ncbi:PREDICTED: uncharacterized protein LOC106102405 [Papilio polytes]|uniref:uncharacterized protein LOC106102405 n=1 Tax=Papilio polytes TaxID=76194 RepID=UPI000676A797|nr:PREDICTED: uncharacterized protein LOC106102405 [Papilio polytes]
MSEDPLVYLPVERWGELKAVFKSDWPRSISGFTILENIEYILQQGIDYGFKVYCPYGEPTNGMVAFNRKKTFNEIVIQTPNDDTSKLEEALKTSKLIDWTRQIEIPFAPKHVMDCVRRINLEKKMKTDITRTETFVLDKDTPLFEDIRLPDGFTFKQLTLDYMDLVDSTWPHRYDGSDWYFDLLTRANLGYGLFKENDLIAWVFIKEMGALGHLYTLEEHRQKGYGEIVLKLMSNILLEQKRYVVAFCVEGNKSAYKLYKKLGFEITDEIEWCALTPS